MRPILVAAIAAGFAAATAAAQSPTWPGQPDQERLDLDAATTSCQKYAVTRGLSQEQADACIASEVRRAQLDRVRESLFRAHLFCRRASEARHLTGDEVDACANVFLRLKLSFLEGVSPERYTEMKPSLRATANRKGYDAFRAWQHARRDMVEDFYAGR